MVVLKEHQQIIIDNVRKMAGEQIAPLASQTDREGRFRWDTVKLLADMGLLQIFLPLEYGGIEEDKSLMFCLCTEEVAKVCASSALAVIIQAVGAFPIIHAGSKGHKERFFPRLATGEELIGYFVTEPQAGSDVASVQTRAKKTGDGYTLKGRKRFATNGGVCALATVLAKTGEGQFTFFVVEMGSQGVGLGKEEDKLGFRGSNTQEIVLDEVYVPDDNRIGEENDGFAIAMKDFDMSRPGVAGLALGISEGAVDLALDYGAQRFTFGKPLIEHQAIEFMIADACTSIEAGRGLMTRAAELWDQGKSNTKLASMAKYFCSDAAVRITADVVQILGGYGYCKDFPAERMYRDAKLTQIFEGANQIQRMVVGREIRRKRW